MGLKQLLQVVFHTSPPAAAGSAPLYGAVSSGGPSTLGCEATSYHSFQHRSTGPPTRKRKMSQSVASAGWANEPVMGWRDPPLPKRLTFWVLSSTVATSPRGDGGNPTLGDLVAATAVHGVGEGPLTFPLDPLSSLVRFAPGDSLGPQVMSHWPSNPETESANRIPFAPRFISPDCL
jgi:hypothetical protein